MFLILCRGFGAVCAGVTALAVIGLGGVAFGKG